MYRHRMVVCAAVCKGNVLIIGPRHWDQTMHMQRVNMNITAKYMADAEQGFIDQFGVFMDRKEALLVAKAANQIKQKSGNPDSDELFSEDLY